MALRVRSVCLSLLAALTAACTMETSAPRYVEIAPVVVIQAPVDQSSFTDVDTVEFRALVTDGNGLNDVASVRWTSSVQGPLDAAEADTLPDPAGHARLTVILASGIHAIEIQVTDTDGLVATDAITVRVEESLVAPTAEIVDPPDLEVFDLGETIPLTGFVSDPNQTADTLWTRWSAVAISSGAVVDLGDVVPGADGTVTGTFPGATEDAWILALEVTDDEGHQAIDRVQITVRDPLDLDNDLDGWSVNEGDCDDADPDVFPGNAEVCDGRDNDCNAAIDDKDADLDHHVDVQCTAYTGALAADDCDDARGDVFPGVIETPDGVDQDCDGYADEGTALFDDDGDCACEGPGVCSGSIEPACDPAAIAPGDCDDADLFVSPYDFDLDGTSACDGDCDDREPALNVNDLDADGHSTCAGDCDDDPTACGAGCFPGNAAADVCDGHNQDCDADVDEDPDVPWYPDRDLDGWTDADRMVFACADPDGSALAWLAAPTDEDCDDTSAALNLDDADADGHSTCAGDCDDAPATCGAGCFPGNTAADVCDGRNQDCDALTDEDPEIRWYHDADLDGWTGPGDTTLACVDPDGTALAWLAAPTLDDCDDGNAALNLDDVDADGFSTCDDDCDDDDAALNLDDADGDGFSTCDDDCDDDPTACGADCFPDNLAPDVCDGHDQDCDEAFDEDPDVPWFHDADGDGYTDATDVAFACLDPDGTATAWLAVATAQDCDDDPAGCGAGCFPGNTAADVCDGQNQDCDASLDEDPEIVWYHDLDGDGFTKNTDTVRACVDPDGPNIHWLAAPTTNDCDDSPATCGAGCWPGNPAPDVCDGRDQDCDGSLDEQPNVTWYRDGDLDGWTRSGAGSTTNACSDPDGAAGTWLAAPSAPLDCDDADPGKNHDDFDGDGWVTCAGDCDDDPTACGADCHPGNIDPDVCDGKNQDCDGSVDENPDVPWYRDQDADGFTLTVPGMYACADPDGGGTQWLPSPTVADCDDSPAACGAGCYPGNPAPDVCDGRNQDCDGSFDENPNIAWFHDADGDGFTNNADTALACTDPDGVGTAWRATATTNDCDDNPGACGAGCWPGNPAADVCDGYNQDCDGVVDEQPNIPWYRDGDLDGWTRAGAGGTTNACADPDGAAAGWLAAASVPTDCDDADAGKNHDDFDADGWVTCAGDCDDDPTACGADCHPGNTDPDVCDGRNQDCDGSVDENPDTPWYRDQDGDGYTLGVAGQYACTDPDGAGTQWRPSPTVADCDDSPLVCGAGCYPGNPAADVCDGRNQDCDGAVDENPNITWYHDADGDGFTNNADTALACVDPDGVAARWRATPTTNDCDDNVGACGAGCWPGNTAADVCDGYNQDCDAQIDENPQYTWYRDADLDTWTAATGSVQACLDPDGATGGWRGAASNPTDCNDNNAALNHNDIDGDTWDTCEGDCNDGNAALNLSDIDGDGWDTCEGDCNDATSTVRPGLADAPDDTYTDNNCDGVDGNVATAVFVSPTGSNTTTCGTSTSNPCATVAYAASRAVTLGRTDLYLRAGTYSGVQAWSSLPGTPRLYGGYSTTWVRGPRTVSTYAATFTGGTTSSQAVGWKITSSNVYAENLIVQSPNASGTDASRGRSSYAIHVKDSTITLRNVTIDPGDGVSGLDATTHGSSAIQSAAAGGTKGGDADDAFNCCDDTTRIGGGARGTNSGCPEAHGGSGGAGGKQDNDCGCFLGACTGNCNATGGLAGNAAVTAAFDSYGWYGAGGGVEQPGGPGRAGRILDGTRGSAGQREGTLSGDWWYGGNGGNGQVGAHGTGGGGGGGSGASDDNIDDWGAGGGGGAAGGCMAPTAGAGGWAGGSSFGIYAMNTTINVQGSTFTSGNGGHGGAGGRGGAGQPGGTGGAGGSSFESAQVGGRGGDGARGGHAGGGGGGAGGNVYGIYSLGAPVAPVQSGNTQSGGTVGTGGDGGTTGLTGTAGENGERTILRTCPIGGC